LDAALLGARTALGSTAVIGLGATALAAIALGKAFRASVTNAADFERELAVFRVTAGATADQMREVSDQARKLGADITLPGVSAQDAAVALTELSKAGLSVQDSLAGARGALQLATAAQIDNAQATEIVANALNAFALGGDQATRVADLLTGAANAAQGSILDMSLALKQSAAVASLVGISVEDTVVILTELAKAGLSASDAGTSFRTALVRLIHPTKDVQAALDKLQITLRDSQGNIRPQIFSEIGEALQKLSPATRQATIAILGGSDSVRAFGLLARSTADQTAALKTEITQQGLAAKVAGAQTAGFSGQMENLKNEASNASITIGNLTNPVLSSLAAGLSDTFQGFNLTVGAIGKLVDPPRKAAASLSQMRDELLNAQEDLANFRSSTDNTVPPALLERVAAAKKAFTDLGISVKDAAGNFDIFNLAADSVQGTLDGLIAALRAAGAKAAAGHPGAADQGLGVQGVLNRITGFDSAETRARIHGDNQELLGVLQSEQSFLEDQLQRAFVTRRPKLQHQLEQDLLGVVNDIGAIQDEAIRSAKQGADKRKAAAADAARAQQQATQEFIDSFAGRRQRLENRLTTAETSGTAKQEIALNKAIVRADKDEIDAIKDRIRHLKLHGDALKTAKATIATLVQEIFNTRNTIAQLAAARKQNLADARQSHLEAQLSIAETTASTQDDVAAQKALIKFDQQQIRRILAIKRRRRLTQDEAAQLDAYRVDLAQRNAALKGVTNTVEDTGKKFKELTFAFLQTQAGFAANLLGNLIPGGLTGGLVGGQTGTGQGGLRQVAGGFEQPRGSVESSAALASSRERGVRPVQVDTTNHLLRQILKSLQNLNGRAGHPEARYQDHVMRASFDGVHGN